MKILFVMLRPGYVRNFESTIRLLADRGHTIHIAFSSMEPKRNSPPELPLATRLVDTYPEAISFDLAASRPTDDKWFQIAAAVRGVGDFGRFVHPRYRDAVLLRRRAHRRVRRLFLKSQLFTPVRGVILRTLGWLAGRDSVRLSGGIARFTRSAEQAIPPSRDIVEYVRRQAPDVVLVTPVVDFGSDQAEYFKAAQALGIPSAVCVFSWDNLTNKGVLRVRPERAFVWNEVQSAELAEMHGLDRALAEPTGAARFDEWFERRPSRTAEDLKTEVGLDPGTPYVLYLCSSPFIAPEEVRFVRRWISAIRSSDALGDLGLLVRPHPQNAHHWADVDLTHQGSVAIWPRAGAQVVDDQSKADFFDAIAHSSAVVGINTSAQIEAAILGKSVLTVLDPDFAGTQRGTLHYHYLRAKNGGFLHEARDLDEHISQLHRVLGDGWDDSAQTLRFVESFVRPHGLGAPATPRLADGIAALAGVPVESVREGNLPRVLRFVLAGAYTVGRRSSALRRRHEAATIAGSTSRVRAARHYAAAGRRRAVQRLAASRRARAIARRLVGDGDLSEMVAAASDRARAERQHEAIGAATRDLRAGIDQGGGRLVVQAWTGDVTQEVLYWIPYLRFLVEQLELSLNRVIVHTRPGVESWYRPLIAGMEPFSAELAAGDEAVATLGPVFVQQLFKGYWNGTLPLRYLDRCTRFGRIEPAADACDVPDAGYMVVCAEFCRSFPDGAENRRVLRRIVPSEAVREGFVVVPHDTGQAAPGKVVFPLAGVEPARRAAVASAVIGRASAVVGTLGSDLLALGPAHGVPTVALYSGPTDADSPLVNALWQVADASGSFFTLMNATQLPLLASVLGLPAYRTRRSGSHLHERQP